MKLLNKLERRFGRYAIRDLSKYIIVMYAVGFFLQLMGAGDLLALNPYLILRGEVWRIFTFVMMPPTTSIIFAIFVLYFYYWICQSLESLWGAFRFNLYYFMGVLGTIIASFITYAVVPSPMINMSTYYLNLSLFLAFAASFPDVEVRIYFLLPIKIKWLAILDAILLGYSFITISNIGVRVSIVVAILNFIVFYFMTRNYKKISPREVRRRQVYKKNVQQADSVTRHKCAVCHRTELDDPTLEFRFCSKCDGNYEYCQEHLFTHTHVKK